MNCKMTIKVDLMLQDFNSTTCEGDIVENDIKLVI
jgi:hypothetical protein